METLITTAGGFFASAFGRRVRRWLLDVLQPERPASRRRILAAHYLNRRAGRRTVQ